MSKDTFENLDSLILGGDQIEIGESGPTDFDNKSKEDIKTDDKSEVTMKVVSDDNMIELDEEITESDEKEEKEKLENTEDTINKEDDKTSDSEEKVNPIEMWGNHFKETSILSDDDLLDFDGSMEGLTKAFEKREVRVGLEMVEDYKSQLPDVLKYLADNWEEGVPLDKLINIKSNQIKYSILTDENIESSVDTQKSIYSEYLKKTTKYSDTKIEKEINRLVDLDELKDEAKEVLVELKKIEAEAEENIRKETKKEQELRREENHKLIKSYEKASKEIKEIVPGIKISEKEQKEVFDKTVNPIGIDGMGNPVSYLQSLRNPDPITYDLKANWFAIVTKGYTDFSKISNAITTGVTKNLTNMLNIPAPKTGSNSIDTSNKKGVLDYLSLPQNKIKK
jgi:hypothetical protein